MGKITKLKNGKYRVSVYDKYGKRHRKVFEKENHGRAFINNLEKEKTDFKLVENGIIKPDVLISSAVDEFLKTKKELRKKSVSKYEYITKQFAGFCQQKNVNNIKDFTRDHADKFKDLLEGSGASSKTITQYLQTVKAIFKYQVSKDNIAKNPIDHVIMPIISKKNLIERENEYYNKEEIQSFFKQEMSENLRNIFTGLFLTGCRIEEFTHLTCKDSIDLESRMILIRTTEMHETKTEFSESNIPITNHLFKIIQKLEAKTNSEFIFTNEEGNQIKERWILDKCKEIAKNAGITKNATVHKWRHSFSSHMLITGLQYEEREYLMRHKPEEMTAHYTKVNPRDMHEKLSKLDEIIKDI